MNSKIDELRNLIARSNNIVFFGGAGVSTESGIPDFRSKDGLYNQEYKYSPEVILGHNFFIEEPEEFYKFYKEKMNVLSAEPNVTHKALTRLEEIGKLKYVITQNIDGLHQKAGNKKVAELHGSILRNYCLKCKKEFTAEYVFNSEGVPRCKCGGIIKPDVVLYGEHLNVSTCKNAIGAIEKADLLIVGGTSLNVYPANSYLNCFNGSNLVIINKEGTNYDSKADLVINESLCKVFEEVIKDYK